MQILFKTRDVEGWRDFKASDGRVQKSNDSAGSTKQGWQCSNYDQACIYNDRGYLCGIELVCYELLISCRQMDLAHETR